MTKEETIDTVEKAQLRKIINEHDTETAIEIIEQIIYGKKQSFKSKVFEKGLGSMKYGTDAEGGIAILDNPGGSVKASLLTTILDAIKKCDDLPTLESLNNLKKMVEGVK